ncbi:hypothetical protein CB1_000750012 [Camelus ferus]|nr:hypothetical protein CB1_000750012 [Camelus ferus]
MALSGHEAAGRGVLGAPVGRVRVLKTLGLLPTHWLVKPDAGIGADDRQAELVPGVWLQGPGIPELVSIIGRNCDESLLEDLFRNWAGDVFELRAQPFVVLFNLLIQFSDKECEVGRYCHSPHQGSSACMVCRRKKKRCHRDGMCCPGTRCNNGHEGDPCLRSSDCIEGFCCARHFWTKICKPVLHQGEVCTKQRKKGSHGLEIFQRCDCAKGLSCKVWKDATYSSKARLHVCQKI